MKQECPTYLKTIGKSKALASTLSDTEPEDELDDSDDKGILNAFIAIVDPTDGVSKTVDDEKLYSLAIKKLSDVDLDWEEFSTKVDEANQTIGDLQFENNFLAKKTKKLEVELLQVRAQLERTFSVKLDEMLSFQKSASDRTGLGYDFSSPNIASSSTTVFVSPVNNVNSKNNECKTDTASENVD